MALTYSFVLPGYPLPVVLNDQSAAVLPAITTDKAIDVVRPLEVPEGIRDEYVTANKKVHQDCKSCPAHCPLESRFNVLVACCAHEQVELTYAYPQTTRTSTTACRSTCR